MSYSLLLFIKRLYRNDILKTYGELNKGMEMNEYQQLAQRTARKDLGYSIRLAVAALGLCGEAGEVSDIIKKNLGHGHPLDCEAVKKELGDQLWYVQELCELLGFTLEEVAQANIEKLKKRYPEGFKEVDSINRCE